MVHSQSWQSNSLHSNPSAPDLYAFPAHLCQAVPDVFRLSYTVVALPRWSFPQRPDSERDFGLLRITSYLDKYPWKERLGQIIDTDLGVTFSVCATRTCRYGLRPSERAYAQPSISTTSWQGWNTGFRHEQHPERGG